MRTLWLIGLNNHIKLKYSDEIKRDFPCPTCKKSFTYESNLKRHIKSEGHQYPKDNPVKKAKEGFEPCPICGKSVLTIKWHMKKHHQNEDEGFACSKCDKKFKRIDNMQRHEASIHKLFRIHFSEAAESLQVGPQEWKCKICKKSFDSVVKLEDH